MSGSLGSMFVKLGFSIAGNDLSNVENFDNKVTALSASFLAVNEMSKEAIRGINGVIQAATSNVASLQSFKNVTGESTQELQKFALAMQLGDPTISFDQAKQSAQSFIQNMSKIMEGAGGNMRIFAQTGVDFFKLHSQGKDFEIMKQVGNVLISNTTAARSLKTAMLEIGGFDPRALAGFEYAAKHAKELEEFNKKTALPPETLTGVTNLTQAQIKLNRAWELAGATFTAAISPLLTKFLEHLTSLIIGVSNVVHSISEFTMHLLRAHPVIKNILDVVGELALGLISFRAITAPFEFFGKLIDIMLKATAAIKGLTLAQKLAGEAAGGAAGRTAAGGAAGRTAAGGAAAGGAAAGGAAAGGTSLTTLEGETILEGEIVGPGILATLIKFGSNLAKFAAKLAFIGAIFEIFSLVFDDINSYFKGKKSIVGTLGGDPNGTKLNNKQKQEALANTFLDLINPLKGIKNIQNAGDETANFLTGGFLKHYNGSQDQNNKIPVPQSSLPSVKNTPNANTNNNTVHNYYSFGDITTSKPIDQSVTEQIKNATVGVEYLFNSGVK